MGYLSLAAPAVVPGLMLVPFAFSTSNRSSRPQLSLVLVQEIISPSLFRRTVGSAASLTAFVIALFLGAMVVLVLPLHLWDVLVFCLHRFYGRIDFESTMATEQQCVLMAFTSRSSNHHHSPRIGIHTSLVVQSLLFWCTIIMTSFTCCCSFYCFPPRFLIEISAASTQAKLKNIITQCWDIVSYDKKCYLCTRCRIFYSNPRKTRERSNNKEDRILICTMVVDKCKSVQLHWSSCFLRIPTILLVVHYHHDVLLIYLLFLILLFSEFSDWNLAPKYTGNA